MAKSGTNRRQKRRSVLVRLDEDNYARLSDLADADRVTRAEYLRCRIAQPPSPKPSGHPDGAIALSGADRKLLADCHRGMGMLAGLMKRATFEVPRFKRSAAIGALLEEHHRDLQELQNALRLLLARLP